MESMINLFNRHKEAGTCGFASWCDFVSWLHSSKPDKTKLVDLKELSAGAYKAITAQPKSEKAKTGKAETEAVEPVKEHTDTAVEPDMSAKVQSAVAETRPAEATAPKKRKTKAGE